MGDVSVGVTQRGGVLYLSGYAPTEGLGWMWLNGHHEIVAGDANPEILGEAVHRAMAASADVVPHPDKNELKAQPAFAQLRKLMGVRGQREYYEGSVCVMVDVIRGAMYVTSTKNEGPRNGFVHTTQKEFSPGELTAEELGAEVLSALAHST